MNIPEIILKKIEALCEGVSSLALAKAYSNLSIRYRGLNGTKRGPFIESDLERLAYLVARFPATYAVNAEVARQLMLNDPHCRIRSFLDLGAGSGASSLAWILSDLDIEHMDLLEQDAKLVSLGKSLFKELAFSKSSIEWIEKTMDDFPKTKSYELILMSYSLNELQEKEQMKLLSNLQECHAEWIVLIEPGRQENYIRLMQCRDYLTKHGYFIAAPCPHEKACPLLGKKFFGKAWCHFSKRLPRTSMHRLLKDAELGFEDEKFSYLILSKKAPKIRQGRIISTPQMHSGFVKLRICAPNGVVEESVITKKNKALFKSTKKLDWGDPYNPFCESED